MAGFNNPKRNAGTLASTQKSQVLSISLSLDECAKLSELQQKLGFSNRSKLVRAALSHLALESRERLTLDKIVDAVLLVIHSDEDSEDVLDLRHRYGSLIRTQLHQHLENEKCLEIFVLNGLGKKIQDAASAFRKNKNVELAKLMVA
ncbi:MAG: CopG family ribbon-helix-helix protein [Candidatus Diapherotrites archaeon]|nr:CopG family ribbon-helix-helix protein [Candidatus Diapherotrites archaeon]